MGRTKKDIERTMTLTTVGLDKARKELSRLIREAKKANAGLPLSEQGMNRAGYSQKGYRRSEKEFTLC